MALKIIRRSDCGNSPKNELLQALTIALAEANLVYIRKHMSEDVLWLQIGRKPVVGADAVSKAITRHGPATELAISHVISHGRAGAVDGEIDFSGKRRSFCNVFEFANSRASQINAITTYTIALR